jgi:SPP1 gp7 family putative phage head morphogenesis protein
VAGPTPKAKAAVSVNVEILDRITTHAVDLSRLEADAQRRVLRQLKQLEKELIVKVFDVDPTGPVRTAYRQARLDKLLEQTQDTIKTAYGQIKRDSRKELKELAAIEGELGKQVLEQSIPISLNTVGVSAEQLAVIASDTLISGAPTAEWWAKQSVDLQQRFKRAIRQGMLEGETVDDLVRRVRGTRAGNFTDGIMRTTTQHAQMLVRSSVQTVANRAREAVWDANKGMIKAVVWRSTLDRRTSLHCQSRDGLQYTLDHKPIGHSVPWGPGPGSLHPNCRSTTVPVVKSWKELGIKAKDLDQGTRSSMDGYVPEKMNFEQWLKGKPKEFQNEVLGKGKAALWRSGKLKHQDLINNNGRPLRLDELREKVKKAA